MPLTLLKYSSEFFNTDKISTFLASLFWFLCKILIFGPVKNQSILLFSVSNFHHSVRSFQKWHFLNTLDFGSLTRSTPWNFCWHLVSTLEISPNTLKTPSRIWPLRVTERGSILRLEDFNCALILRFRTLNIDGRRKLVLVSGKLFVNCSRILLMVGF